MPLHTCDPFIEFNRENKWIVDIRVHQMFAFRLYVLIMLMNISVHQMFVFRLYVLIMLMNISVHQIFVFRLYVLIMLMICYRLIIVCHHAYVCCHEYWALVTQATLQLFKIIKWDCHTICRAGDANAPVSNLKINFLLRPLDIVH